MSTFKFNLKPRKVQIINTNNRKITTRMPVPESIYLFKKLKQLESKNAIEQLPIIWDKAIGYQIFDPYGNIWIDFTSSIFVTNSGHGNKEIINSIIEYLKKPLLHSYYYPTEIRLKFLEKLISICPKYLKKIILLSAGTEATERAMKIATIYGQNQPIKKNTMIAWEGNYHGKTLNAQMLSGQFKDQEWIKSLDKNIVHLPFPYPWTIEKEEISGEKLFYRHLEYLKKKGIRLNSISSFFLESFQGYGAIFYPKDYVQAVKKWAVKNKSLLIFDEVQAGFWRTGKLFAYQHYSVHADLVICGKGISSSLPLSAVIGKSNLIELDSYYTSTHGGHPLVCAAGLANLKFFDNKKFKHNLEINQKIFKKVMNSWKKKYKTRITRILGKGMMYGVFINKIDSEEPDEELTNIICERAMEKGVFSICTGKGTIKLGPPLTISKEALLEGLDVYEECFQELF